MDIVWYGHSCFRLSERRMASVVTDPFDHQEVGYGPLSLKADIVTVSHDAPGHNYLKAVKGRPRLIQGPGEYEIGGVFIIGIQTNGKKRKPDEPRNTLYVIEYNGIYVAHLGDLRRVPTQAEIEALGTVHVALVPVGGGGGLNASKAAEVISLLEPGIVIPMHYGHPAAKVALDPLRKFLKEMGLSKPPEPQEKLSLSASRVPSETRVVVLQPKSV